MSYSSKTQEKEPKVFVVIKSAPAVKYASQISVITSGQVTFKSSLQPSFPCQASLGILSSRCCNCVPNAPSIISGRFCIVFKIYSEVFMVGILANQSIKYTFRDIL